VEAEKSLRPPPWPHDRPSSFNHGDYTSQANNNTSLLFHYQHYYHHHSYHHQPQQPHQPIMFTPTSDKSILPPSPTKRRRRKSSRWITRCLSMDKSAVVIAAVCVLLVCGASLTGAQGSSSGGSDRGGGGSERTLRCYVCGAHKGIPCEDISPRRRSPYRRPTPQLTSDGRRQFENCTDLINNKACIKQVVNGVVLLRGCWMQHFDDCLDDGDATVCTCKGDLCNSAHQLPSIQLLTPVQVLAVLLYYYYNHYQVFANVMNP